MINFDPKIFIGEKMPSWFNINETRPAAAARFVATVDVL